MTAGGSSVRPPELPPGVRLDGRASRTLRLTLAVLGRAVPWYSGGAVDVQGLGHVPQEGPLLVCSNHLSNFDPLVLAALLPRLPHAFTKAELFDNPLLRAFLVRSNCFPVRRGEADRRALLGGLAVLRSGGALIVFPEGHRAPPGAPLAFAHGPAYLALKSRAQILPCAIWGTEAVLPPGRLVPRRRQIHLRFGVPWLATGELRQLTAEIQTRVLGLLPGEYRGSADPDQVDGEDQSRVGGNGGAG